MKKIKTAQYRGELPKLKWSLPIEIDPQESDVVITYEYEPEVPAPYAVNHDDPAFSDPGSGEEINVMSINRIFDGKDLMHILEDRRVMRQIEDAIRQDYSESHGYSEDDRGDEEYHRRVDEGY